MTLIGGSAQAFIIKMFGVAFFLGYTIFLARILPASEYGTVMYAITVVNILAPICLLGFDKTVLKFSAVYWIQKDFALLTGLLRRALRIGLGTSLFLLVLTCGTMTYSKFHLLGDTGNSILMAMIILPFWVWVILNRAFLRGMKLLGSALIGFQIVRPGLAAVFTGIAYYFGIVGPYQAIVFLSSALVVTIVINNYQINTALGSTKHTPRYEIKHWKATAKPLFLSTVLSALMSRADMVMVGSLLGMEEAARYAVAHRLAILLTFALDAVRTTFTPQISEYYYKKNSEILQKKMTQASQLIFFTTVPLAALLLFFPQVFLGLFGEGYKSAGNILIFLTIGQLINSLTGTVSPLLTMTAYQGIHARIIGVTLAIYLLLNFVLIKLFGAEGAAIATSIIIGVRNIWLVIVAKEKLNIITYMRPKDIFLRLHLKSLFGRKMGK